MSIGHISRKSTRDIYASNEEVNAFLSAKLHRSRVIGIILHGNLPKPRFATNAIDSTHMIGDYTFGVVHRMTRARPHQRQGEVIFLKLPYAWVRPTVKQTSLPHFSPAHQYIVSLTAASCWISQPLRI